MEEIQDNKNLNIKLKKIRTAGSMNNTFNKYLFLHGNSTGHCIIEGKSLQRLPKGFGMK